MKPFDSNIFNKKGDAFVEASLSLPLIILTIFLLLRIFTFYLSILTTSINEHEKALDSWDKYNGKTMQTYESEKKVQIFKGGILGIDLAKKIKTKAYFYNEDILVRANEVIKQCKE